MSRADLLRNPTEKLMEFSRQMPSCGKPGGMYKISPAISSASMIASKGAVCSKLTMIATLTDPPVTPTRSLTDKDVIQINVWANAATVGGITDHHVVQTPFRDK